MAPPSDGSRQVRFDLENGHVVEPRNTRTRASRGSSSQDHEDRSRPEFASDPRQSERNHTYNMHGNNYHHSQYGHHGNSPQIGNEDDEDDDGRSDLFVRNMPVSSPNAHPSNSHNRYPSRSPMTEDDQPMPRPNRPTLVQRTPSNTYAPPRGRPPTQQTANVYGDHHRPNARRREFARRDPLRIWRQEKFGYDYRNNDSDSDGETATTDDVVDSEAVMFYNDDNQEPTEEDFRDPDSAERLHWQRMLSTALSGDVIGQEKKRLTPGGMDQEQLAEGEMFIMLRAARFRRHVSVQRKILTDARNNLGRLIDDIMNFTVKGEEEADGKGPYEQVQDAVKLIEKCESLYPSSRRLEEKHHAAKTDSFVIAYSTIIAWYNTTEMLNTELKILRRWVGNKNLSIEKSEDGVAKEASSFIHRLLNNGSLGSLFPDEKSSTKKKFQHRLHYQGNENPEHSQSESEVPESAPITEATTDDGVSLGKAGGMLINLFRVVDKAKTTLISMADAFEARHLPLPIEELATIINFPLRLIQTMLQEQVANAKTANIKSAAQTNTLILDQMIAQFKTLLRMSVDLNKKYLKIIKPERNWDIPDSLDETYASDVFNALRFYFKMLNWKLSNNKNTFKEAEVLFQEWEFANNIGGHFKGWEIELAEHFSHVTHKTLTRLATTFEREMREKKDETTAAMSKRIKACLDSVRVRQRMLQRFSRLLNDNYENACDYSMSLEPTTIQEMVDNLAATHHVRLATHFDKQGFMLICSPSLARARWKLESHVQAMMAMTSKSQILADGETHYVAIIKAEDRPIWMEDTINLELSDQTLDLQVGHVRLLAASTDERYEEANDAFLDAVEVKLDVVMERRSNLAKVNQKLTELRRVAYKVSNTVMDSVETIRAETRNKNCEELVQTCFMSATEFGQRALQYMDENRRQMNNIKLSKLALDWVSFINEDCMGTDKRTFRWAMQALDFVSAMTRGRQILGLTEPDWARLRRSVSGCMTMLVLHLDVMGARSSIQAKAEAKRKLEVYEQQTKMAGSRLMDDDEAAQIVSMTRQTKIQEREKKWAINDAERMGFGRVLEDTNDLDRSLMDMSSATNNGTLRWQMGQFVGSGAFGSVYVGVNLSRGQLMAVKEIRLQDPKSVLKIKDLIIHEVNLLKALDHPNVVACYGVEVRRDRVFIFMEFCSGGSLAGLLEHGPIDDEMTLQELTLAMLEGLRYLHSRDIVHRDIKPANILLDHAGVVKFVDFGAAKVIVRHNHTTTMEINPSNSSSNPAVSTIRPGTTGTPMYMAPEVVRGEQIDNPKASDIWSLGCVILELVTGQRPWPAADNEFAIMFNIGNGMVPDMPSEGRLSDLGRDFLSHCLQVEPAKRATAEALLQHPWIVQAIASAKDMEVETPSDSSQNGTPSGNRMPVDGLFPSDQ
ncbi:MAP kinase kinase kinase wis4 [Ceratocystis fimbriata CBS 114723]|uniref:mitogen-activated protein kinase n=1 Tax=Ceratocystis fimbriata CBS 114723 TaxID=1035309 RepID=A0A2C5X1W2_9PEZI|nr:MAP kinase kinase kinase wis4 [Ceratocystis fimbriata CBS 114723]